MICHDVFWSYGRLGRAAERERTESNATDWRTACRKFLATPLVGREWFKLQGTIIADDACVCGRTVISRVYMHICRRETAEKFYCAAYFTVCFKSGSLKGHSKVIKIASVNEQNGRFSLPTALVVQVERSVWCVYVCVCVGVFELDDNCRHNWPLIPAFGMLAHLSLGWFAFKII